MLIAGLGNPGDRYRGTRHNAGFRAVDIFVAAHGGQWKLNKNFSVEMAEVSLSTGKGSVNIKVLKPLLYMNKSGKPLGDVFKYYHEFFMNNFEKTALRDEGYKGLPIVVVYDELDFEPPVVRIKTGGSAGGHNGLSDIIRELNRDDFLRIRIGIGHPRNSEIPQMSVSDWVLFAPKDQEFEKVEKGVSQASSIAEQLLTQGIHSISY